MHSTVIFRNFLRLTKDLKQPTPGLPGPVYNGNTLGHPARRHSAFAAYCLGGELLQETRLELGTRTFAPCQSNVWMG